MKKSNLKEMAVLNEELRLKPKFNFKPKDNPNKYNKKAQKIIFAKIKYILKNQANLKDDISESTIAKIKKIISNKNINEITEYSKIKLIKECNNKTEFKDLKKSIDYFEIAANMQVILKKEMIQLKQTKINLENKIKKDQQKKNNSYLAIKKTEYLKVQFAKNRTRIKDVEGFIQNKSTYRKLYLSDEPPLSTAGWLKLFVSYGLMFFWALIILWPIAELVKATTNDAATTYLDTSNYKFGFSSFTRLINNTNYLLWLKNTLIVSAITSSATVFFALLMGYAFSRFRFKGKKASLLSVMILQMVPTMASLTVFYVLYTILHQKMGINGQTVLIFIYVGGGIAGNTFIMKGYMDSISIEIDEAAKIDGLSQWKIFTRIIIPLTKPMIALVALWSFIGPFGDYILPGLLLNKSEDYTLARGLNILITDQKNIDQAAFAAGSMIIAVPISLLFISLRKFLIGGITAGGVKG